MLKMIFPGSDEDENDETVVIIDDNYDDENEV